MNELMSFLSEYGVGISLLFQFVLALLIYWLKDKFAPAKLVEDVAEMEKDIKKEVSGVARRVQTLENQMKHIPTKDDFHRLEKSFEGLRGELKRVDENIDGAEGLIERLEAQVNRMDEFWRAK